MGTPDYIYSHGIVRAGLRSTEAHNHPMSTLDAQCNDGRKLSCSKDTPIASVILVKSVR